MTRTVTQLSFYKELFPCDSATCKSHGDVAHKVKTTFYPHGKNNPRAWTHTELLCKECTERLRKQMQDNEFISMYNDIVIEDIEDI